MTQRALVIVGAGGHAKVVLEAIRAMGCFEVVGATDPSPQAHDMLGIAMLGGDDVLADLRNKGVGAAAVALGDNGARQKLGSRLRELGFALPAIIHPQALISPTAAIHDGAVIMARAIVGTASVVHELAIINTGAIIDHDNVIGEAAHIAPGCALAGWVQVGARSLIGVGSAIKPKITIGADVVVGAGSAVIADVPAHVWVGGVPARRLHHHSDTAQ